MTNGKVARWWCWEPIMFYGLHWGRTRPNDVFEFAIGQQKEVGDHPCPKPLRFWHDLITNYSESGEMIVDLFLGVGTALVAAEQSERVCYGVEMDPAYVDVSVRRWENLTGRKAVRERQAVEANA